MLGLVVPLLCARQVRAAKSLVLNRYLLGVALFELFFFAPFGAYLYYFYPAWSLMYFTDPGALAPATREALGVAALCSYLLAITGGFVLSAGLTRAGRETTAWLTALGVALALAGFSLITLRQLNEIGTYADWIAVPRTTTRLYAHRIGVLLALDVTAATAALFFMLRAFRAEP